MIPTTRKWSGSMFIITYELNGVKDSLCVRCKNLETAIECIDKNAKILEFEKLY